MGFTYTHPIVASLPINATSYFSRRYLVSRERIARITINPIRLAQTAITRLFLMLILDFPTLGTWDMVWACKKPTISLYKQNFPCIKTRQASLSFGTTEHNLRIQPTLLNGPIFKIYCTILN